MNMRSSPIGATPVLALHWTTRLGLAALGAIFLLLTSCAPGANTTRVARSTLVIGIDVSGSFRANHESSIDFAANYLYARLHGLGGLKVPTAVFVGSIGGERPQETKSFQPIHTFQALTVPEIAEYLRKEYPSRDGLTDFNPFFTRVAKLVKRQGLVLSPIDIVLFTDGIPDMKGIPGDSLSKYKRIDLANLEYLSKSVTLRVLYPRPTVAVNWEQKVPRHRVRMWTVDDEVMNTWQKHHVGGLPPEQQGTLWKWISDNVDYRVRSVGIL
jgi:hypothetical protein